MRQHLTMHPFPALSADHIEDVFFRIIQFIGVRRKVRHRNSNEFSPSFSICYYPGFHLSYSYSKDAMERKNYIIIIRNRKPAAQKRTGAFGSIKIRQYEHMNTDSCHLQECFAFVLNRAISSRNCGEAVHKNKGVLQFCIPCRHKLTGDGGTGSIFYVGIAVYRFQIKSPPLLFPFVEAGRRRRRVQPALPRYQRSTAKQPASLHHLAPA